MTRSRGGRLQVLTASDALGRGDAELFSAAAGAGVRVVRGAHVAEPLRDAAGTVRAVLRLTARGSGAVEKRAAEGGSEAIGHNLTRTDFIKKKVYPKEGTRVRVPGTCYM